MVPLGRRRVFLGVTGAVVAQIAYTILALAALPVLRRRASAGSTG